jgi:hypothetical protein
MEAMTGTEEVGSEVTVGGFLETGREGSVLRFISIFGDWTRTRTLGRAFHASLVRV